MLYKTHSDFPLSAWRWPHFTPRELACRCQHRFCASEYWHDADFLDALESLRAAVARPLVIRSGHRCAVWNVHVGGASRSMHRTIAVDIARMGHDLTAFLAAAGRLGFTGIGVAASFIHLDRRATPARWTYAQRNPTHV
jgi:hypothetical protein